MNQIIYTIENETNKPTMDDIFRIRYETFIERLGWNIQANNGLERDRFDDLTPFHIALKKTENEVSGCWRALPTKGDYMLRSVFSELLQGENIPEEENVWEISRFAVRKDNSSSGYMSEVTTELLNSFFEFAQLKGIKKYVTVTSLACERMLKRGGIAVRRMGEGKVMKIGVEKTVALWIDLEQSQRAHA
jgi:acyl homoserine lactone synthase